MGDPIPIAERKRLAAQHPPHIILECSGGPPPAIFQNNAWNRLLEDIVVFDDVFIDKNVHSGLALEAHHRQSLHELILGAQAVAMNQRLQTLVAQIEAHNTSLRTKAGAIPAVDRGPYSVDDFCALAARPDINQAIKEAERALEAAREQDAIHSTPPFDSLNLPTFDLAEIEPILHQDLSSVDAATLTRVHTHLAGLGQDGEDWVADGMRRIPHEVSEAATRRCPFCAQDLQGSPIIEHYRAYFSEAYATLKRTVADTLEAVNRTHGGDVPAGFERAVRLAVERRQFWSRFCDVAEVTIDTAAIVRDWRGAREAIIRQLVEKEGAPLEHLQLSEESRTQVATFEVSRRIIATLNLQLQEVNRSIAVIKEKAATADSAVLADDLARLKAVKARHTPATVALCESYLQEQTAKEATEQQRDDARAALEHHRTAIFPGYQTAINLCLQRFNAGFRLDSVTHANTRGGPTCTYNVVINNTPVPMGGADLFVGQPSFRSTLSAGDRNTLALAFFFASLDQDASLANKVIVIDDPISSLDEHRALTTVQEIRRLSARAGQVIVLSHNKPFLCRLWEGNDSTARAALEVVRDGTGSTLRVWNVVQDSITEHDRRHAKLLDYLANGVGDMREMARSIRPHLEAFVRVACPEHFPPGRLLGPFLNVCRNRVGTPVEILNNSTTQELEQLVEYANRFHHNTNPAWETETINDGELRGFVDRTLKFVRK
jgi:wobble nucleotide-excising tRNase